MYDTISKLLVNPMPSYLDKLVMPEHGGKPLLVVGFMDEVQFIGQVLAHLLCQPLEAKTGEQP